MVQKFKRIGNEVSLWRNDTWVVIDIFPTLITALKRFDISDLEVSDKPFENVDEKVIETKLKEYDFRASYYRVDNMHLPEHWVIRSGETEFTICTKYLESLWPSKLPPKILYIRKFF